jgi:hypothetical protein
MPSASENRTVVFAIVESITAALPQPSSDAAVASQTRIVNKNVHGFSVTDGRDGRFAATPTMILAASWIRHPCHSGLLGGYPVRLDGELWLELAG